jgi:hypothetical protein
MHYGKEVRTLDKLTMAQQTRLSQLREEFFGYATSTVTDRQAAEAAARVLLSSDLEPNYQTHWVKNPEEGWVLLGDLRLTAVSSVRRNPTYAIWCDKFNLAQLSISKEIENLVGNTLCYPLQNSLSNNRNSAIYFGLGYLQKLIMAPDSLILDSLQTPGYIASSKFYRELGVRYTPRTTDQLGAVEEIIKSAFAVWVIPTDMVSTLSSHVVLCDKPTSIEIENDIVVGMDFAD